MKVARLKTLLLFTVLSSLVLMEPGCHSSADSLGEYFADVRIIDSPDSGNVTAYIVLNLSAYPSEPEGLAHYTEHLVWQNVFGGESSDAVLHSNAWTNARTSGYWLSGPREKLPELLRDLSRVFDPLVVAAEFADGERDILVREYEQRLLDNTNGQASIEMNRFLYQGNAIAASAIGTPDSINALTYADAALLQKATHTPGNAFLVIVGDVSEKEVLQAIKAAEIPALQTDEVHEPSPVRFQLAEARSEVFNVDVAGVESRIVLRKVVALEQPVDFDTLEVQTRQLREVLISSLPGGLAGPLRFDAFVARSFNINVFPLDEQHLELWFEATPDSGVTLDQLQSAFEATLNDSMNGIPVSTFERIRKRSESDWPDWDDESETSRWMARYVIRRTSSLREPLSSQKLQGLQGSLSLDALNRLLKTFQGDGRKAVALIQDTDGEE